MSCPPRRSVSRTVGLPTVPQFTRYSGERPRFRHIENLLFAQSRDIAVVDFFFLVGQLFELLEHGLQLLAGEMKAHALARSASRRAAAVLAHHQIGFG